MTTNDGAEASGKFELHIPRRGDTNGEIIWSIETLTVADKDSDETLELGSEDRLSSLDAIAKKELAIRIERVQRQVGDQSDGKVVNLDSRRWHSKFVVDAAKFQTALEEYQNSIGSASRQRMDLVTEAHRSLSFKIVFRLSIVYDDTGLAEPYEVSPDYRTINFQLEAASRPGSQSSFFPLSEEELKLAVLKPHLNANGENEYQPTERENRLFRFEVNIESSVFNVSANSDVSLIHRFEPLAHFKLLSETRLAALKLGGVGDLPLCICECVETQLRGDGESHGAGGERAHFVLRMVAPVEPYSMRDQTAHEPYYILRSETQYALCVDMQKIDYDLGQVTTLSGETVELKSGAEFENSFGVVVSEFSLGNLAGEYAYYPDGDRAVKVKEDGDFPVVIFRDKVAASKHQKEEGPNQLMLRRVSPEVESTSTPLEEDERFKIEPPAAQRKETLVRWQNDKTFIISIERGPADERIVAFDFGTGSVAVAVSDEAGQPAVPRIGEWLKQVTDASNLVKQPGLREQSHVELMSSRFGIDRCAVSSNGATLPVLPQLQAYLEHKDVSEFIAHQTEFYGCGWTVSVHFPLLCRAHEHNGSGLHIFNNLKQLLGSGDKLKHGRHDIALETAFNLRDFDGSTSASHVVSLDKVKTQYLLGIQVTKIAKDILSRLELKDAMPGSEDADREQSENGYFGSRGKDYVFVATYPPSYPEKAVNRYREGLRQGHKDYLFSEPSANRPLASCARYAVPEPLAAIYALLFDQDVLEKRDKFLSDEGLSEIDGNASEEAEEEAQEERKSLYAPGLHRVVLVDMGAGTIDVSAVTYVVPSDLTMPINIIEQELSFSVPLGATSLTRFFATN